MKTFALLALFVASVAAHGHMGMKGMGGMGGHKAAPAPAAQSAPKLEFTGPWPVKGYSYEQPGGKVSFMRNKREANPMHHMKSEDHKAAPAPAAAAPAAESASKVEFTGPWPVKGYSYEFPGAKVSFMRNRREAHHMKGMGGMGGHKAAPAPAAQSAPKIEFTGPWPVKGYSYEQPGAKVSFMRNKREANPMHHMKSMEDHKAAPAPAAAPAAESASKVEFTGPWPVKGYSYEFPGAKVSFMSKNKREADPMMMSMGMPHMSAAAPMPYSYMYEYPGAKVNFMRNKREADPMMMAMAAAPSPNPWPVKAYSYEYPGAKVSFMRN